MEQNLNISKKIPGPNSLGNTRCEARNEICTGSIRIEDHGAVTMRYGNCHGLHRVERVTDIEATFDRNDPIFLPSKHAMREPNDHTVVRVVNNPVEATKNAVAGRSWE